MSKRVPVGTVALLRREEREIVQNYSRYDAGVSASLVATYLRMAFQLGRALELQPPRKEAR